MRKVMEGQLFRDVATNTPGPLFVIFREDASAVFSDGENNFPQEVFHAEIRSEVERCRGSLLHKEGPFNTLGEAASWCQEFKDW